LSSKIIKNSIAFSSVLMAGNQEVSANMNIVNNNLIEELL
jgi:hypothetical protein